jgi:hypothetical protein
MVLEVLSLQEVQQEEYQVEESQELLLLVQ